MWEVQTRRRGGKWVTRYALETEGEASFWYRGLNTFGNYRKRVIHDGKVIVTQVTSLPWGYDV